MLYRVAWMCSAKGPGPKAVKAFSKAGWIAARQTGSHLIMVKEGSMVTLSVPMHNEDENGPRTGAIFVPHKGHTKTKRFLLPI